MGVRFLGVNMLELLSTASVLRDKAYPLEAYNLVILATVCCASYRMTKVTLESFPSTTILMQLRSTTQLLVYQLFRYRYKYYF